MKTFLTKLQEEKKILQATCNGKKTCGQCKIKLMESELSITEIERKLLSNQELNSGIRLACCHRYLPDIKFELINSQMDILEDIQVNKSENSSEDGYGVIVDIGTTTVVIKWISLCDGECHATESFLNPQATYGGDVISRIQYNSEFPHVLNQVLRMKFEKIMSKYQNIKIKRMIVCGNTVMTHLFLDSDITSLGQVPFNIPIQALVKINSLKILTNFKQSFEIYTFPHISAFVGGDIVAGILALNIDQENELKMLIDLGTNGEIVIGNKEGIITTSTAAGPAFEGVGITCGGPSIPGAITKVSIQKDQIIYETISNQDAICICGSGLISLIAELKRKEIINELGRFIHSQDKFYITESIYITEKDIQTFQLAKAAIQAGVTTLLNEKGEVSEIFVSGGLGTNIDANDLIEINIFPKAYLLRIRSVKNSALSGAYQLLRSQNYKHINQIVENSENINLAEYPGFDEMLIDGLYF